jgi:hypothetical protein
MVLSALMMASLGATPSSATQIYADYSGTNFDFTGIQETSTFGDPEPLFGAPTGSGNQLLFFPTNFSASAGGGGFDQTGSQLQLMVAGASPTDTISAFQLTEAGDTSLAGAGTAATGTFVGIGGTITVLKDINGVLPVAQIITFDDTDVVYAPTNTFNLVSNPGTTGWSAMLYVDIAAIVPDATKIAIGFDNNLFAFSEGTTASSIQKKAVSGPTIVVEVLPEPGTAILMLTGLMGLTIAGRRRR